VPYRIEFTPSAARAYEKLERLIRERLAPKIDSLADNPRPHGAEKLAGAESRYRLRSGDYRIIYAIEDGPRLVTVAVVAHRREVYR
jgi:mRNA interferase RelE/StbE